MAIIQCPECHRDISDKALSCPHCGYPLDENTTQVPAPKLIEEGNAATTNPEPTPEDFEDTSIEPTESSKKVYKADIIGVIAFVLVILSIGIYTFVQIPYKKNIKETAESFGLKDVSVSLTYKVSYGWWNATIRCSNFDDISHSKKIEVDREIGEIRHIYVESFLSEGSKYNVYSDSIYKDGELIYNAPIPPGSYTNQESSSTNSSASENQAGREIDAWVCSEDIVKNNLKAPSTAKFCSYTEATVTYTGGANYTVKGYVDAENSFGAMIRNNFTVTLTLTASGYKNGSVIFS